MTLNIILHPATVPEILAAWLWVNVVPFGLIGVALAMAGNLMLEGSRRQQRMLAALVVALVLSTCCTTGYVAHRAQVTYRQTHGAVVVYDFCNDPNIPYWLWLLDCLIR